VISEGIAKSALETAPTDQELEDLYREEILPPVGMTYLDAKKIMAFSNAKKDQQSLGKCSIYAPRSAEKHSGNYFLFTKI
jgi:hypothetical protein